MQQDKRSLRLFFWKSTIVGILTLSLLGILKSQNSSPQKLDMASVFASSLYAILFGQERLFRQRFPTSFKSKISNPQRRTSTTTTLFPSSAVAPHDTPVYNPWLTRCIKTKTFVLHFLVVKKMNQFFLALRREVFW